MIRAPSVFGEEHAIVAIVEREIMRLGLEACSAGFDPLVLSCLDDAQPPFSPIPGRRNLIARIRGSGTGRSLILNCHLDTVPPGDPSTWDRDAFSGAIVDGYIHGRGAYDDKAGAVICLGVLKRLSSEPLAGDVIAQFVLEDEITGNGSLLCLEKHPHADAAIIIDGTRGDRGINEHAGNLKMQLNVSGKPASVSVSHMGRNAAEILAHTMLVLKQSVSELNSSIEPPWTQFPSPNQLSTIALNCEETTLTVPSAASAKLYATFTPPHTVSSFLDLISAKSREAARQAGADCAPEINVDFAAEAVRSKSSAIECVISRAAGRDIAFGPSTGTSDMRHFIRCGIPCVLFGPGRGYNPHRANEHFELRSLKEMTELLTDVALCWCK